MSPEDQPLLLSRPQAGVALLALHRPKALNALSTALRKALVQAFNELRDDDEVKAVVLTGSGQAFCAGLDLRELSTLGLPALDDGDDPVVAMLGFSKPLIGAINGAAVTGGLELALGCDLLIASSMARFADTHARIGVIPGWGLSQKLSRIIGMGRAKEMSLSGNFIDADCAERWGLVNRVVEPDALLPAALALAADMATADARMVQTYKRLIDDGFGRSFDEAMKLEREVWTAWSEQLSAQALGSRRDAVLARGREQQG